MSWLKIDDGFEDHPKVELLSNDAHRLWLRAACWCRKAANARTRGFVPRAMLESIAKRSAPLERLLELAAELVAADGGGMFEHGLWEPVEGGWLFHDWDDYQPEADAEAPAPKQCTPKAKAEAGRVGGRRSAEVRKNRYGTAQPGKRTEPALEAAPKHHGEAKPEAPRSTPEAPDPFPDPYPSQPEGGDPKTCQVDAREAPLPDPDPRKDPFGGSFCKPHPDDDWVFRCWRKLFGKSDAVFDNRRGLCIIERRLAGMTRQDAVDALHGAAADPYVNGKKDGKKHDRLSFIFGQQERFEEFRDAGRAARQAPVEAEPEVPDWAEEEWEQAAGMPCPDDLWPARPGVRTAAPKSLPLGSSVGGRS